MLDSRKNLRQLEDLLRLSLKRMKKPKRDSKKLLQRKRKLKDKWQKWKNHTRIDLKKLKLLKQKKRRS